MEFNIKNTKDIANDGVKILLHSASGTGKTTQLGTVDGKVLVLSAESGLLVLKDKQIDVIDIDCIDTLARVYVAIKDGELVYDTVCLDSLSEISDMIIEEMTKDEYYSNPSNAFVLWKDYSTRITKIVKMFRDLKGINVVFTALTEPVESNGMVKYTPQIQGKKAQSKLVSLFDNVIFMNTDKDGKRWFHNNETSTYVAKSRSVQPNSEVVSDEYNVGTIIKNINKLGE